MTAGRNMLDPINTPLNFFFTALNTVHSGSSFIPQNSHLAIVKNDFPLQVKLFCFQRKMTIVS